MSIKSNQLDFTGQNIYVGIDTHKKSFTVTLQGEQLTYKTFSQPPDPTILVEYLSSNYPGASYYAAYEASFSGFWIQEQLQAAGVNCIVVNPCDVPTTDKEKKQKRDPLDSRKLARSLKNGELTPIYIPGKDQQMDRGLLRTRKRLVADQTRCRNRIKALLDFYGIHLPDQFQQAGTHWSKRFMGWLKACDLKEESGNQSLSLLIEEAEFIRSLVLKATRKINELSRSKRFQKRCKLLLSVPGVGRLTAMILLTEIGEITRFKSLDHLCSYVGLIPNIYASGDIERVGEITKRGNRHLRAQLVESSWVAVRNDPALTLKYQQLCGRMKGNKAIIRITRKLLNRIRYVLINEQEYELAVAA
jgi:transposase